MSTKKNFYAKMSIIYAEREAISLRYLDAIFGGNVLRIGIVNRSPFVIACSARNGKQAQPLGTGYRVDPSGYSLRSDIGWSVFKK